MRSYLVRRLLAIVPTLLAVSVVIFLLLLPVLILMAAAAGAAIFGNLLTADAEARHEGSELLDLSR